MIGTISHDIKGVLTNLDGGLYLIRSSLEKEDVKGAFQSLTLLDQAVDRIKKLILDILMYSKERKLALKPVGVPGFVKEICQAMALKIGDHPISFRTDTNLAPDTMIVDADRMMSALINILDNAVDACKEDLRQAEHHIDLVIEVQDNRLEISVRDDGCGMDFETREKIFDLFYSSKRTHGTGFGLFITHSIITRHQGAITVDSMPGRGTGFHIHLPLEPDEENSSS